MSDMIDRLSELANEAGADVSARLASPVATAALVSEVGRGVRRRRAIAASLTAAVVVIGAAAAVIVPRLMEPAPIPPAGDVRVPVQTTEGLITYSDGSMQVLTQHGEVVDIPAPAEGAPVFTTVAASDGCAAFEPMSPGWTVDFPDAFELLTFGRPLVLDATGFHVLTQGQTVPVGTRYDQAAFAFSLDVDPAIASQVVITATSYTLAPDGRVAYFQSQLESKPAVDYTGDRAAGTYSATLTTRLFGNGTQCPGVSASAEAAAASGLVKYLVVTAFLNDGHGSVSPIATHTSWVTIVKEDA